MAAECLLYHVVEVFFLDQERTRHRTAGRIRRVGKVGCCATVAYRTRVGEKG